MATGRTAPFEIVHRAAPCRNVPVTFTLDIVETRVPVESDLPSVRALLHASGWQHRLVDDAWLAKLIATSHSLVACEDGVVVGFARAVTDGLSNGYLSMVAVSQEHRRKGIGSRLVLEIMGDDPGVTWVLRASRPGAREFFETLGFRPSPDAMERKRAARVDI